MVWVPVDGRYESEPEATSGMQGVRAAGVELMNACVCAGGGGYRTLVVFVVVVVAWGAPLWRDVHPLPLHLAAHLRRRHIERVLTIDVVTVTPTPHFSCPTLTIIATCTSPHTRTGRTRAGVAPTTRTAAGATTDGAGGRLPLLGLDAWQADLLPPPPITTAVTVSTIGCTTPNPRTPSRGA